MDDLTLKKVNVEYIPSIDGGLDIAAAKERFSSAYVKAMCAAAKVNYNEPKDDDSSVDIEMVGRNFNGPWSRPRILAQLKCTSNSNYIDMKNQVLKFPLPIKNYNDLRETHDLPKILIVVYCPTDCDSWIDWSALGTKLRFSGYWLSIEGREEVTNGTSVTVEVPFKQEFNHTTLLELLNRLSERGI